MLNLVSDVGKQCVLSCTYKYITNRKFGWNMRPALVEWAQCIESLYWNWNCRLRVDIFKNVSECVCALYVKCMHMVAVMGVTPEAIERCQVLYSLIHHHATSMQSLTEPETRLDAGKQPEVLLSLLLSWSSSAGVTGTQDYAQLFVGLLRIWIQILMFAQQVLIHWASPQR